jgi:Mg2+ and Co2+ transporter CorA
MELLYLKKQALVNHLKENDYPEVTSEDISEGYNESNFEVFKKEYNIFTEEEREKAVTEYIKESIWAFNADFIMRNSRIEWNNNKEFKQIEKALQEMQEKLCESANPLILALIDDLDSFVYAATSADGYGNFLSSYDSNENEERINDQLFYIYRQN